MLIQPVGANQFELTFSVYAVTQEVKSLSFSLTHTKSDRVDTTFVSESFSSNDYTAKFVDDISVYEINDFENETLAFIELWPWHHFKNRFYKY